MVLNLEQLYAQDADAVYAFFARFRLSEPEAEDAVHDTFVTAMQRQASYDQKRPVRPVALGHCLSFGGGAFASRTSSEKRWRRRPTVQTLRLGRIARSKFAKLKHCFNEPWLSFQRNSALFSCCTILRKWA